MSERIPPFLSASPPPFDEDGPVYDDDDDNDDDFGEFHDFSSAAVVSSDTSLVVGSSEFHPIEVADPFTGHSSSSLPQLVHPTALSINELSATEPSGESISEDVSWSNAAAAIGIEDVEPAQSYVTCKVEDSSSVNDADTIVTNDIADAFEMFPCSSNEVNETCRGIDTKSCSTVDIENSCSDVLDVQTDDSRLTPMLPASKQDSENSICQSRTDDDCSERVINASDELSSNISSQESLTEQCGKSEQVEPLTNIPLPAREEATFQEAGDYNHISDEEPVASYICNAETPLGNFELAATDFDNEGEADDGFANFEVAPMPIINSMSATRLSEADQNLNMAVPEEISASDTNQMIEYAEGQQLSALRTLPMDSTTFETESCPSQQAAVGDTSFELVSNSCDPVGTELTINCEHQVSDPQDSFDDEFDEFEEFKSADQAALSKAQVLADSSAGEWAAFSTSEPTDDGDDWAAFQEPSINIGDPEPLTSHPAKPQDAPVFDSSHSGSSQVSAVSSVVTLF
jgi:hypothetical protein